MRGKLHNDVDPNDTEELTGLTNLEAGARVGAAELALETMAEDAGVSPHRLGAVLLTAMRNGQESSMSRAFWGGVDQVTPSCREMVSSMVEGDEGDG